MSDLKILNNEENEKVSNVDTHDIKNEVMEQTTNQLEPAKVSQHANQIQLHDNKSVLVYGADVQNELSKLADVVLDQSQDRDVSKIQKSLDHLLDKLDDADPDNLITEEKGKFGQFLDRITNSVQKQLDKMRSTSGEVDKIKTELNKTKTHLEEDAVHVHKMLEASKEAYQQLDYYIAGADEKINEIESTDIPKINALIQQDDPTAAQQLNDVHEFIDSLNKRKYSLQVTQQTLQQSIVQLGMMERLNYNLASQIQDSIVTSIPLWRTQLATAITLMNQRSAIAAKQKVQEANNEMFKRNADNVAGNLVNAAKESNRDAVDLETLKYSRDKLIDGIKKAQDIAENAKQSRKDNQAQLEKYKQETQAMLKDMSDGDLKGREKLE